MCVDWCGSCAGGHCFVSSVVRFHQQISLILSDLSALVLSGFWFLACDVFFPLSSSCLPFHLFFNCLPNVLRDPPPHPGLCPALKELGTVQELENVLEERGGCIPSREGPSMQPTWGEGGMGKKERGKVWCRLGLAQERGKDP